MLSQYVIIIRNESATNREITSSLSSYLREHQIPHRRGNSVRGHRKHAIRGPFNDDATSQSIRRTLDVTPHAIRCIVRKYVHIFISHVRALNHDALSSISS